MCGIAGLLTSSPDRPPDRDMVKAMTRSLAHRGPDGEGFYWGDGVALGHRRLSIIDIEGGAQPMMRGDGGPVVTFNGEIYNFRQLARELGSLGHVFKTRSDTEVLLASYEAWGVDCVRHLRGMFAFAIWDPAKCTLFLARDRLGIKPFYYTCLQDGTFLFGSELKALLTHPQVRRHIDLTALDDYLALGYVPDPKCLLEGIYKLPPAHTALIGQGEARLTPHRYWRPPIGTGEGMVGADMAGDNLIPALRDAIEHRMIADVPLGAFLSGGMDSGAVVALMSSLSAGPVETCTIGSDTAAFDERDMAALVADTFGTRHRSAVASPRDEDTLNRLPFMFDEPFADPSALPTYRVSALARERVTVALSGDGGDELFAGYRRYRFHMAEERIRRAIPCPIRRHVFGPLSRMWPKMDWAPRPLRAKATLEGIARSAPAAYFNAVSRIPDRDRYTLYTGRFRDELDGYHPAHLFERLAGEVPDADPLTQVQYIDLLTYIPGDILTKVDRTSMAVGLEVRVPLLDHVFVGKALAVPASGRLKNGQGKAVFREALKDLLPPSVLSGAKKGFSVPLSDWFRTELGDRCQQLARSEALLDTKLFAPQALSRLTQDHMSGRRDHGGTLWSLMMLDTSLRHLDARI
ncbi:XrtA/PEP-CTERM system amidotransferase [Eilatimonas milleporae]|uniref:asparagine synthase (glutamine-hydrolyzing) n=1 Tax=Eilatimonas milleporae TaxID=911205 RepID=A0A3M0CJ61_9PROT|nr:XrtA/PEP-CTERM system amidotransferase [Eilatimonas milleporae]RMB08915.1 asparagine synthase (glutamine-hydrolysing) [Eilatimonas milleporae]